MPEPKIRAAERVAAIFLYMLGGAGLILSAIAAYLEGVA